MNRDYGEPPMRPIKSITIKRRDIKIDHRTRDYGHWWFEFDGNESYGWYPTYDPGLWDTFRGVPGELNGIAFGGLATQDAHHGDPCDYKFHPLVNLDDMRTESEIKDDIRNFAGAYSGEWRWTFGYGQNCRTFQKAAMKYCKLYEPKRP